MHKLTAREFLLVMWWEAVQNIPLIAGVVAAYWFWEQSWLITAACIVTGSVLSALSMIPTEGRIFEGHRESVGAIIGNICTFSVLMTVYEVYLKAPWSSWWTDIIAGIVAGAALGMAQDLAAKEKRIGVVRILALGISCLVSLLIIRFAIETWPALVSFAVVTTWFTLAMGGYKLWRKRHPFDNSLDDSRGEN
jgi:hypothetical protein